jgi:predicted phage terminase large subunit-like protein
VIKQRQQNRLVWSGQFQQEPVSAEGNLIRTDDILFFGGRDPKTGAIDPELPESFERKIVSVDCRFKDLSTSDFVCIIVVGLAGSRRYLLHVTNAHLDLTGTENEIRNCHATFGGISGTLIEDKANGPSVVRHLQDTIAGVVAINPEGGKMSRMMATAPEFQAHNWIIERNGPWTNQVITQLTLFPVAKHDDIADAISQCSIWLQANTYELGLLDYFKKVAAGLVKKRPSASGSKEAIVPSSCRHCGSYNLEKCGTGASTRLHCLACGKYSEGLPVTHPCPKCAGKLTGVIAGNQWKCRQCGFQFRPDRADKWQEESLGCLPGCPTFLRQIVAGRVRCGNCGAYHTVPSVSIGMNRKEYERGGGRSRSYGRFD